MTQYELLKTTESLLSVLSKNNIDANDVKYLELYGEYRRLKDEGHKVCYIVHYLSEQYNCGVATVYRVVKRMEQAIE
ncbi:MAG: hypothetical protein PUG96_02455 [Prevotellaceae bacterium]|nr:hypothetical protein [Prevotella sp.]MDD7272814.1 hypothetical protein [Prevotellaceae bacterium]